MNLSKSKYCLGVTCKKKLWLETNKPEVKEKQNVQKFKWSNYYLIPIIGLVILISVVIIIVIKNKKKKNSKKEKKGLKK